MVRRFPIGLTVASLIAFVVLCALGAWQVKRLEWKQGLLAHIAALQSAPAVPIDQALASLRAGRDVAYTRVRADCVPIAGPAPVLFRFAERGEQVAWRALTICRLADPHGYDGIVLDRGLVDRFTGQMEPAPLALASPGVVIGVLRDAGSKSWLGGSGVIRTGGADTIRLLDRPALLQFARHAGLASPAPVFLAAERETPTPPGVTPIALPESIPNNHLVYALTWFSLAGILLVFYVAMLRKRGEGQ